MAEPDHSLSPDGMTLVVRRRVPGGMQTATIRRQRHAGPFTDADVALALQIPAAEGQRLPGQRNITRRAVTRFGTLWVHLMLGPPTWWHPRIRHEKDGTLMAGWLRAAIAVKLDLPD